MITKDVIDGFKDSNDKQKKVFADHRTVFMLTGLHKKWKQPIAYYFVESCMNSDNLVQKIKSLVQRVTQAGFKVVATVCGQSSPNSSAIDTLIEESRKNFTSRGEEFKSPGFFIQHGNFSNFCPTVFT